MKQIELISGYKPSVFDKIVLVLGTGVMLNLVKLLAI
jgi:hypothetical protein